MAYGGKAMLFPESSSRITEVRTSMDSPPPYTPTTAVFYDTREYMANVDDGIQYFLDADDAVKWQEEVEVVESDGDYVELESGEMKIVGPKTRITFTDHDKKIRKIEIGERKPGTTEKVIMMVGATGSGKTTLINGMYNCVVGVEWKDDFRVKLIEENSGANQAKSQTSWITAYTIHHKKGFKVPYTLTIIDTPGFGDTSGIKRDEQITEQIRSCFQTKGPNGIDHLDAVGFVAQSSLPRLTPTQRYVFDSILSLFGKDIEENIFMLLTFADSQKPQVLSGIKEANMPYKKSFKFNNSALFVSNQGNSETEADDDSEDTEFDEMFWKMGEKSFRIFTAALEKAQSQSLVLTKDVLEERHRLEVTIEGIQKDVKMGLNKLEQLRVEQRVLDQHQADIDKNKNFTYTVNEQKIETEPVGRGQYTTNCLTCNTTCHERCIYNNDRDKAKCSAMRSGKCRICDLRCHWTMHRNQPFFYVIRIYPVTKTAEDLRKRYQEASGKKITAKQLVWRCQHDFKKVQDRVLSQINQARKSIEKLNEIALRPHPLSTVDYIDILIKGEKTEGKPGWKERMDQLMDVRQKAVHMEALANQNYDPFAELQKTYDDERKQRQLQRSFKVQQQQQQKLRLLQI